jgi:branched-chain amino acid transport system ATP-binding protein
MRVLELRGVAAGYGASQVLFDIDFEVGAGEVVGLLGRNGMGKTTLLRSVLGWVQAQAGTIALRDSRIDGWSTDRIAREGVALVPEGRRIFPNLSVSENLSAFAANRRGAALPWNLERVWALFPRLAERRKHLGNQLSGGEQQMLAIGRALMANPHLLLIDEASEGLAPLLRENIWRCLHHVAAEGQSIVVVDKYLEPLLRLASRHYILERGRVVWNGTSAELAAAPSLIERYLGV